MNKKYPWAYYPVGLHAEFFDLFGEALMHISQENLQEHMQNSQITLDYLKALILVGKVEDWNLAIFKPFSAEAKPFYGTALKVFYHINDPYFNALNFWDRYNNILAYVTGKFLKAQLFPDVYSYDFPTKAHHVHGRQDAILEF